MMHICMMHLSMIHDPDSCMYDAYIYVPRSLTLMHVCMMHISMILKHACMYGACIYDAAEILSQTNGRTDKTILRVGLKDPSLGILHSCILHFVLKKKCKMLDIILLGRWVLTSLKIYSNLIMEQIYLCICLIKN